MDPDRLANLKTTRVSLGKQRWITFPERRSGKPTRAKPLAALRQEFHGPLIVANGFTRETATRALAEDVADAVAFGRLFLANPDLPQRFRLNVPLNTPDQSTFYGGAAKGYTDYPALGQKSSLTSA